MGTADFEKRGERTSAGDRLIGYAFLRIVFGLNIFFHGISRLMGDHLAFFAYLSQQMGKVPLPKWILPPFAAALPWTEAAIGLLLFLGLFTRFALVVGSLEMIVLMAGITLAENSEVAGIQLIYCFIYFLLLTHRGRNFYSLDTLIAKRQ